MRDFCAIWAGRSAGWLSRRLGRGGGTTLPGRVALRVAPAVIRHLTSRLPHGVVLVAGTNGKTTTSRMIAALLSAAGLRVLHNRSGANLQSGVAATTIAGVRWDGTLPYDIAVFECDEAALPQIIRDTQPRLVLLHNLFRDQLDRYGEVDTIAANWQRALAPLPATTTVLYNADDPSLARLALDLHCVTLPYGNDAVSTARDAVAHLADAGFCRCGSALEYTLRFYGHVGHYRCPQCGFARPQPLYALTALVPDALRGSRVTVQTPQAAHTFVLPMPGLYNALNAVAAIATSAVLGLQPDIDRVFAQFHAAFGRYEVVDAPEHPLVLALIKNPIGASETVRMLVEAWTDRVTVLVIINDLDADGTDVSWLWDADFEALAPHIDQVVVSGTRAADMHVRLKYAGIELERIRAVDDVTQSLDMTLAAARPGETVYILPTYTAMLALRAVLVSRGWATAFWND